MVRDTRAREYCGPSRRRSRVPSLRQAVVVLVVLGGCTDVPRGDDLELRLDTRDWRREPILPDEVAAHPSVPPETRVDDPAPSREGPRVVVGPYGRGEEAECPFSIQTLGFPAVSLDGSRMVSGWVDVSGDETSSLDITWHDVETDSVLDTHVVFQGLGFPEDEGPSCRAQWREIRRTAAEVNDRLREEAWRPMPELAVEIHDPYGFDDYGEEFRAELLSRPASERPVEVTWRWGDLVVRIPGVRVIARVPAKWYGLDPDPFCQNKPRLHGIYADEETGVAAVMLDYQSGACLCWTTSMMRAVRLPPEVFAWVRKQPLEPKP
jgi:hypothetical protein